jgi:hypothetical protein
MKVRISAFEFCYFLTVVDLVVAQEGDEKKKQQEALERLVD